jgi:hypothetical protein
MTDGVSKAIHFADLPEDARQDAGCHDPCWEIPGHHRARSHDGVLTDGDAP